MNTPSTPLDFSQVAALVPCYNEEVTIGAVIDDLRKHLPGVQVFVIDNNSSDATASVAAQKDVEVIFVRKQGKGYAVRAGFQQIDAKAYLLLDGDATYPADEAARVLLPVLDGDADMTIGCRLSDFDNQAFRRFHLLGNHFLSTVVSLLFGTKVTDLLSGYRSFSREFVQSIPLTAKGFEIETDLTLQALSKNFAVKEVPIRYLSRPEGSESKLQTWSDGALILKTIFKICKDYQPLFFFSFLSLMVGMACVGAGILPITDYMREQYVHHVPLAILAAALGVLSFLLLGIGFILDSQKRYHHETFVMMNKLIAKTPSSRPQEK